MKFKSLLLLILVASFAYGQLNISLKGQLSYSENVNDIWGYVDELNNEYALIGVRDGFSIASLVDPENPSEIYKVSGSETTWRDVKTWQDFAYVTSETGDGLLIVDMSPLPASTTLSHKFVNFPVGLDTAKSAHNIYISEGYAYLFGTNRNSHTVILDLSDPWNPVEAGAATMFYAHDGFVQGDTMFLSHVSEGTTGIYDITDKSNPVFINSFPSPAGVTHNIWLSDNGDHAFVTDEQQGASISSYDITDYSDVELLDEYRSTISQFAVPHNTHFYNNYLVNSYYADGVTIVDVTRPNNMVVTGYYDTSPVNGTAFKGVWGVYPFLPSGLIIATDVEDGLYVLEPNYKRAGFVEGNITEEGTGFPIGGASVELLTTDENDASKITGNYAIGYHQDGNYQIKVSKPGYESKTVSVTITEGLVNIVDVELKRKDQIGLVVQGVDENGVGISKVWIKIEADDEGFWEKTGDANGYYNFTDLYDSEVIITTGLWGFKTQCKTYEMTSLGDTLKVQHEKAYYDDFSLDYFWTTTGDYDQGRFIREVPIISEFKGDTLNPPHDVLTDGCGHHAYATGNTLIPGYGGNEVNQVQTTLKSPLLPLNEFSNPYISFWVWFQDYDRYNPADDTVFISLVSATDTVRLDSLIGDEYTPQSRWNFHKYRVLDHLSTLSDYHLLFSIIDIENHNVVEVGIDWFQLTANDPSAVVPHDVVHLVVFPNPVSNLVRIESPENIKVIQVFDMLGRMVVETFYENESKVDLDLSNYVSGVYSVKVINIKSEVSSTLIVKN